MSTVHVIISDGTGYQLNTHDKSVLDGKQEIAVRCNTTSDKIDLVFNGVHLDDSKKLDEYHFRVMRPCILHAIIKQ
jgi:hypothetical protein